MPCQNTILPLVKKLPVTWFNFEAKTLHFELNFHPYKMLVVQTINEFDWGNRKTFAEKMFEILSNIMVLLMSDEVHYHLSGCINK